MAMDKKVIFEFERGAFFSGQLDYRIADMHFTMKTCNAFRSMQCFEFDVTEEDLQRIFAVLAPVKKWKEEYDDKNGILDGFGWSIKYCHKGIKIASQGYEAFPRDYKTVIEELQECMETLCKKYAADQYIEDEAEMRRQL